jgi:hypothetical protein
MERRAFDDKKEQLRLLLGAASDVQRNQRS